MFIRALSFRRGLFLLATTSALGCGHTAGGGGVASDAPVAVAATPPAPLPAVRDAGEAVAHAPPVAVDAAPTGTSAPARRFAGTFEGRAVDPPLRAFLPTMVVEPWTGHGEAALSVPAGDGPVEGVLHGSGGFAMRARGFRYGDHVRATLEPDGPAVEDAFRGMLDAEAHGDALRGTWNCSSGAGRRARAGTLEAHAR